MRFFAVFRAVLCAGFGAEATRFGRVFVLEAALAFAAALRALYAASPAFSLRLALAIGRRVLKAAAFCQPGSWLARRSLVPSQGEALFGPRANPGSVPGRNRPGTNRGFLPGAAWLRSGLSLALRQAEFWRDSGRGAERMATQRP